MVFNRSIVKVYDLIDYITYRSIMLFKSYRLFLKKQLSISEFDNILIIRLGSLGDVIRSTIVIHQLKAKYPSVKVDMLTSTEVLPVLISNSDINRLYTLSELTSLPSYDWIINLQAPNPPAIFMDGISMDYPTLVRYISDKVPHRLMTGRRYEQGKECLQTDVHYCRTEVEEILLTALFRFDEHKYIMPKIILKNDIIKERVLETICEGEWIKPPVGIFIGTTNSIDRGTRSFSLEYLSELIEQLSTDYSIIMFGKSSDRSPQEINYYHNKIVNRQGIIDMVDKTSLDELMYLISLMKALVSTDSSPVHLAMALGVPVVGLYANSSQFRVSPLKIAESYILLDAFEPCFKYTYRWKFFCTACKQKHSDAYGCNQKNVVDAIEQIPIHRIVSAVNILFNHNLNRTAKD